MKTADAGELAPFEIRPILAITEDSDAQQQVFFDEVPVGSKLRVFGSGSTRWMDFNPDSREGWSSGYNFGSMAAVRLRWKAAIDAGVDMIAAASQETGGRRPYPG